MKGISHNYQFRVLKICRFAKTTAFWVLWGPYILGWAMLAITAVTWYSPSPYPRAYAAHTIRYIRTYSESFGVTTSLVNSNFNKFDETNWNIAIKQHFIVVSLFLCTLQHTSSSLFVQLRMSPINWVNPRIAMAASSFQRSYKLKSFFLSAS